MINSVPVAELAASRIGTRHRTVAEDAYAILHEAICTGRLAPGQRLPTQDLAVAMGMSAMPVREALRRLHADGLVENIPHRGGSVTRLSLDDLAQIYEARLALEPLAIRRAAARFSDEDGEHAAAALLALERQVDQDNDDISAWAAHTAFHFALYKPSGSDWLIRLITPLWESSERYRLASSAKRSIGRRSLEHRRILDACLSHDPDGAAQALHGHLIGTANAVCHAMGGAELFGPGGSSPDQPRG